jgi:hypothetical protein
MIAVAAGLRVLVASKPVDFRKGADGLAALVRPWAWAAERSSNKLAA